MDAATHQTNSDVAIDDLLRAVCAEFAVDVDKVKSGCRLTPLVRARWAYALLARRRMRAFFRVIAGPIDGRHPTYAWRWLHGGEALVETDSAFAERVARVDAALWPTPLPN